MKEISNWNKMDTRDTMNMLGVYMVVYLVLTVVTVGNIMDQWKQTVLSPREINMVTRKVHYYEKFELISMRSIVNRNPRLQCIPIDMILNIRKLGIKRKHRRGTRGGQNASWLHSNRHDQNNNIEVATLAFRDVRQCRKNINFGLLNCRSIKNKDLVINEIATENGLDLLLLCETWLQLDTDDIWLQCSELNKHEYKFDSVPRVGKRGGGLGLMYNSNNIKVTKTESGELEYFEFGIWNIQINTRHITVIRIYHPPKQKYCKFHRFFP